MPTIIRIVLETATGPLAIPFTQKQENGVLVLTLNGEFITKAALKKFDEWMQEVGSLL